MDSSDWQFVTWEGNNMLTLFSGIWFLHIAWIAPKSQSNALYMAASSSVDKGKCWNTKKKKRNVTYL